VTLPAPSRRTSRSRPRSHGFTLVEILVVGAIVAIGTTAAWLGWRGADTQGRRTAEAFAGALAHATARAQWRHEDLAVSAGPDAWRFWRRDGATPAWVPAADDPLLAAGPLPDGMVFASLVLAGRAIEPATLVALRANGRNDPATYVLAGTDRRWRVDLDPLNRVSVAEAR
jgi:general secretion pathway protein H